MALLGFSALTGCGGGGGTSAPNAYAPAPAAVSPAPTPPDLSGIVARGQLVDYVTHAPIAHATVTLGSLPASNCIGWDGCGTPGSPSFTATTASDGSWSIANLAAGVYFLTVAMDAHPTVSQTYTILHRSVVVGPSGVSLGTMYISKLSNYEAAWLAQINADRTNVAMPATGPVVIDEYDEEAARAEAVAVAGGSYPYGDSTEGVFGQQAASQPGYLTDSTGGVADANAGPDDWAAAEAAFVPAEKRTCESAYDITNGSWVTCPFEEDTGHYINLAQDSMLWLGLGLSSVPAASSSNVAGWYIYAGVTTYGQTTARTAPYARTRYAAVAPGTRD